MDSPPSNPVTSTSRFRFPFRFPLSSTPSSPPPTLAPNAETEASFLSRIFFNWLTPLILRGSRQPIQQSDLPPLIHQDKSSTTVPIFTHTYRLISAADHRHDFPRTKSPLSAGSIPTVPPHAENPQSIHSRRRLIRLAQFTPRPLLRSKSLRALIPVSFLPFLRAAALKPLWLAANIAQAFCIRVLVTRVTQETQNSANLPSKWAYVPVVLALALAAEIISILAHAIFAGSMLGGMRARAALSAAIYQKVLRLSPSSLSTVSEGEIGNLLVNDTQRVLDSYTYANFCWLGFFEIAVISALLTIDLGVSALFGVAILVLLVPVQISFSSFVCRARTRVSVEADKRVQTMNEVLSGIRTVKLSAWEPHFMKVIGAHRAREVGHLRVGGLLRDFNAAIFFVAPVVVALATFTARTLVFKQPLTPAIVFSTLSFFNTLAYVLKLMPLGWLAISEAIVAGRRLDSFFDLTELPSVPKEKRLDFPHRDSDEDGYVDEFDDLSDGDGFSDSDEERDHRILNSANLENARLVLRRTQFSFAQGDGNERRTLAAALTNISFSVGDGELVCIVGPVGSGKSSLLLGILGELLCTGGDVRKRGRVAYCSQQPWIVNGSLRDNIVMFGANGQEFDSKWYDSVVDACCLRTDIDMLPARDHTEIGERGVTLSGGQKARVSLARAVYSKADLYLLDDPLSAVDSTVTSQLIRGLFAGDGLLAGKAQVVVTHQLKLLPLSSKIVILGGGTVYHSGTFEELRERGIELSGFEEAEDSLGDGRKKGSPEIEEYEEPSILDKQEEYRLEELLKKAQVDVGVSEITRSQDNVSKLLTSKSVDGKEGVAGKSLDLENNLGASWSGTDISLQDNGELIAEEDRCVGKVTGSVYRAYVKAGGGYIALMAILMAFMIPQALRQVIEWWLSRWSTRSQTEGDFIKVNRFHALIFLGLAGGTVLLTLFRAGLFARQSMIASKILHNKLVERVLRAELSFFDTNPLGRILNRFSKDVDHMDIMLPFTSQDCLQIFFVALGALVTISWILPWFLIPLVPIILAFFYLQRYYKMTSRELKRIDGISRSPIYAQFVETAGGLATIRAYESQNHFCALFNTRLDGNNCSYHMFACAGRWLGIRLDALASAIVFCTAFAVLAVSSSLDPGLAGVALTQSILITGVFQWGVRQAAETENHFTSVERITSMIYETPVEKPYDIPETKPPPSWPSEGRIKFEKVELKYRPELDPALQNLSFETGSSERIGIVGRTGSGKSSLFVALFRMVEVTEGAIFLDGVDISEIGLYELRSRTAIVPQDPVLFHGTIRSNLDPTGMHSDVELWDAIGRVHMSHAIEGTSEDMNGDGHGLDMAVCEKGSNFSAGERQLLSLARAILSGVKVVVLDEASASLDNHTDMLVQKTVREQLSDRTVLTIAHRLATIADSDRVLVMDAGEMVEFDSPSNLLRRGGYFAKLVEETGRIESAILKAIIKESSR